MSIHVLLIATRYDTATYYVYDWAKQLRDELLGNNFVSSCVLLDGESLCHTGTSLQDAIDRADFVVFFGHGETDRWVALPGGSAGNDLPLVETASVNLLAGRQVYAACCHSL